MDSTGIAPLLVVRDAPGAITFYTTVFGAVEQWRLMHYHRVGHAVLTVGRSQLIVLDEFPEAGIVAPPADQPDPPFGPRLMLELEGVDGVVQRAVAAGATLLGEPRDQWWGVRSASLRDPFGYRWGIHSVIEQLTAEEMQRRADELGLYPPPAPAEAEATGPAASAG
jgi:PhnB protein